MHSTSRSLLKLAPAIYRFKPEVLACLSCLRNVNATSPSANLFHFFIKRTGMQHVLHTVMHTSLHNTVILTHMRGGVTRTVQRRKDAGRTSIRAPPMDQQQFLRHVGGNQLAGEVSAWSKYFKGRQDGLLQWVGDNFSSASEDRRNMKSCCICRTFRLRCCRKGFQSRICLFERPERDDTEHCKKSDTDDNSVTKWTFILFILKHVAVSITVKCSIRSKVWITMRCRWTELFLWWRIVTYPQRFWNKTCIAKTFADATSIYIIMILCHVSHRQASNDSWTSTAAHCEL